MTRQADHDALLLAAIATGNYEVLATGEIFSRKKSKFLKPYVVRGGGLFVTLFDGGKTIRASVPRLVALVHLPACADSAVVIHKDGDGSANAVCNLKWGTRKEASDVAHMVGKVPHPKGEDLKFSKLTESAVRDIRALLSDGWSLRKLASKFRISRGSINAIKQGLAWRHVT